MMIFFKKHKLIYLISIFLFFNSLSVFSQLEENQVKSSWFRFYGTKHFSDKEIKKHLELQKNVSYLQNQLQTKLDQLLQLYRNDGYLAARIDSTIWLQKPTEKNPVKVYLIEGDLFQVNQLYIFGNQLFSLNQIRNLMEVKPGKEFKPQQLEIDIKQILDRYADEGYLLTKIEVQKLDINYEDRFVDIVILIAENKPVKLRSVEIWGNKVTKASVILREIGIKTGEIVTQEKLQKIPDRLRRLSFINLVEIPKVSFKPDSFAVITFSIQEQNSSQLNGVIGYNPKQGNQKGYVSGLIDLNFQNLLGTGRSFLAYWDKRGPTSQSLRLGYEEPWLFGWPIHGNFGFYQNVQDTSFVRRDWHLGFRVYFLENIFLGLKIGQESVIPDSIGRALYGLPRSQANRLFLEVSSDTRDHIWNPTKGLKYQTSVDFVSKKIDPLIANESSKKQDFNRISLDVEYIQPFLKKQVLMFGLYGRQVQIGDEVVPIDEVYRLGGANDLRGYRDDQFLGSQIAWGTFEYRLILERESRIGLFLDAGYIGQRNSDKSWQQLFRIGYGFGIRTKTNLGIIGFDYGLGKGDSFSQGKIHVRLINTF